MNYNKNFNARIKYLLDGKEVSQEFAAKNGHLFPHPQVILSRMSILHDKTTPNKISFLVVDGKEVSEELNVDSQF